MSKLLMIIVFAACYNMALGGIYIVCDDDGDEMKRAVDEIVKEIGFF